MLIFRVYTTAYDIADTQNKGWKKWMKLILWLWYSLIQFGGNSLVHRSKPTYVQISSAKTYGQEELLWCVSVLNNSPLSGDHDCIFSPDLVVFAQLYLELVLTELFLPLFSHLYKYFFAWFHTIYLNNFPLPVCFRYVLSESPISSL